MMPPELFDPPAVFPVSSIVLPVTVTLESIPPGFPTVPLLVFFWFPMDIPFLMLAMELFRTMMLEMLQLMKGLRPNEPMMIVGALSLCPWLFSKI
jgi:hypothetical protein